MGQSKPDRFERQEDLASRLLNHKGARRYKLGEVLREWCHLGSYKVMSP